MLHGTSLIKIFKDKLLFELFLKGLWFQKRMLNKESTSVNNVQMCKETYFITFAVFRICT